MDGRLLRRTSWGRTSTPLRKDKTKQKEKEKKKKKRRVLLESKDFPEFKGLRRGKGTQQPGEDAPVAPTAAGGGQGWGRAWVCVWWCVFV